MTWICVIVSSFLNTVAQVFLKWGLSQPFFQEKLSLFEWVLRIALQPWIILGVSCYGLSLLFWLSALSQAPLSAIAPFLSLSYVLTCIAGVVIFQESMPILRIFGIGLVLVGLFCVFKSAPLEAIKNAPILEQSRVRKDRSKV